MNTFFVSVIPTENWENKISIQNVKETHPDVNITDVVCHFHIENSTCEQLCTYMYILTK
jgi:hypothetical protein